MAASELEIWLMSQVTSAILSHYPGPHSEAAELYKKMTDSFWAADKVAIEHTIEFLADRFSTYHAKVALGSKPDQLKPEEQR